MSKPLATIPCDNCGDDTSAPEQCSHGWELCQSCASVDCCQGCAFEAAEDRAADRALTAHFENRL
jgi:hypothetical protein